LVVNTGGSIKEEYRERRQVVKDDCSGWSGLKTTNVKSSVETLDIIEWWGKRKKKKKLNLFTSMSAV